MTYEVPYSNYKNQIDNYVHALGGTIPYVPTSDPNVIGLSGVDDVLVSINNGVDKLIFRDQEHFMEWVLKWS